MRRYYISQRFCITLCVGITIRNVYYIISFNMRALFSRPASQDNFSSIYQLLAGDQSTGTGIEYLYSVLLSMASYALYAQKFAMAYFKEDGMTFFPNCRKLM